MEGNARENRAKNRLKRNRGEREDEHGHEQGNQTLECRWGDAKYSIEGFFWALIGRGGRRVCSVVGNNAELPIDDLGCAQGVLFRRHATARREAGGKEVAIVGGAVLNHPQQEKRTFGLELADFLGVGCCG
jgi:hypothetical protein